MDEAIKQIGERLKGLRDVLDITVEKMANTCGITTDEYLAMENAESELHVSNLQKIALKYDPVDKVNAIKCLKRVSRPGLRQYTGYKDMPRVLNGLGIAIISTSKGIMTNKEALAQKVGGEVLCYIY